MALKIVGSSPIIHPITRDRKISGFSFSLRQGRGAPDLHISTPGHRNLSTECDTSVDSFFASELDSTRLNASCAGFSAQEVLFLWTNFCGLRPVPLFLPGFPEILSTGSAFSVDKISVQNRKNPGEICGEPGVVQGFHSVFHNCGLLSSFFGRWSVISPGILSTKSENSVDNFSRETGKKKPCAVEVLHRVLKLC